MQKILVFTYVSEPVFMCLCFHCIPVFRSATATAKYSLCGLALFTVTMSDTGSTDSTESLQAVHPIITFTLQIAKLSV